MVRTNLTMRQIEECITYWKPYFGLNDWMVRYAKVNQSEIPDKLAMVNWTLAKRSALIQIADPNTWSNDTMPEDMEISIVHELFHLAHAGLLVKCLGQLTNEEEDMMVEQPTEMIAESMVLLRRKAKHKFSWETCIKEKT